MPEDVDLEAMSASAAVFVESDYGRYLIGRLRTMHFSKHDEAEKADDDKVARLMHEAAAIHQVLALIDEDVQLHTSKFFEKQRTEAEERAADAAIMP